MNGDAPFRGPGQRAVEAREQARAEAAKPKAKKTGAGASKVDKGGKPAKAGGNRVAAIPAQAAVSRGRAERENSRAAAAALRREFELERLEEPDAEGAERREFSETSPGVWLKNLIGVFLIPVAWVWTLTVFGALQRETVSHRFWATEDFWFFGLGVVCWMVWFSGSIAAWGVPEPMRYYVLGHEGTHAVWAWLSLGSVSGFKFGREGGHILTNKPNFWVTLSPYFYPIYCVVLFLAFGVASIFYDFRSPVPETWWVTPMQCIWFVFGVAWAFHLSFTVWMIRRGQSDLRMHGNFFSLVLIYTMNLVVFTLFLWLAAPGVGMGSLLKDLMHHAEHVSGVLWNFANWLGGLLRHPNGA
jgi:hypothetical protein